MQKNPDVPFAQGIPITKHFKFLKSSTADISISVNFTGVIPQEIIDLFPLGILNVHGGDLPRYRGNACQAWAILNGEKRIGLCIHRMVGGELDSGDIIARDYFSISHRTKITHVWEWLSKRTPVLFADSIRQLSNNPNNFLKKQSTNPKDSLRCYSRKPEDRRIDWGKSALDLLRLINTSNKPYSGAFCEIEGEKVIIWDADLVDDQENFCAIPGQITHIGIDFIEIACGAGKLRIYFIACKSRVHSPSEIVQSLRQRLS